MVHAVPTLRSVDEYEEWVSNSSRDGGGGDARTLVLQFGSKTCPRCPAFGTALAALCASHQVSRAYCDAHDEDDLVEHFSIVALPAFVLLHAGRGGEDAPPPLVVGNATPCQLHDAVVAVARPLLLLDEEF